MQNEVESCLHVVCSRCPPPSVSVLGTSRHLAVFWLAHNVESGMTGQAAWQMRITVEDEPFLRRALIRVSNFNPLSARWTSLHSLINSHAWLFLGRVFLVSPALPTSLFTVPLPRVHVRKKWSKNQHVPWRNLCVKEACAQRKLWCMLVQLSCCMRSLYDCFVTLGRWAIFFFVLSGQIRWEFPVCL